MRILKGCQTLSASQCQLKEAHRAACERPALTWGHSVFHTRVAASFVGTPALMAPASWSATLGASRKERDSEKPAGRG